MAYTTIDKPTDYFNTKLYTGTGSSLANTGVGFQPDLTWIKGRSGATEHVLTDSVRGVTKELSSNDNGAEETVAQGLTAFGSDGFTVGTDGSYNTSSATYASWNWLASNSTASNTDGSITSTVSANTTSGFSIVKVSKPNTSVATIGHGLGVTPKFIIGKDLDGVDNWTCYHESLGNGKGIYLNATTAETTASTFWDSTSPTSSVFTIGSDNTWNSPSIVFYCFAEKQGFSKFGSYTGNGSTDGTFVYTGFKPAFVIAKNTGVSANWVMFDNKRSGFNVDNDEMSPNTTGGDNDGQTYQYVDLLSNGFKWREASNNKNTSGDNFIYMAFAEQPLVGDNPATAR